ncbi:MAG: hypothetical protein K5923_02450 [Clostridia bacterium]|nr:hypothetical protein [Clostridia bacterium]
MKKTSYLFLIILFVCILVALIGCEKIDDPITVDYYGANQNDYFLDKPENTNLIVWVTERYTVDEIKAKGLIVDSESIKKSSTTLATVEFDCLDRDLAGNLNLPYVKYHFVAVGDKYGCSSIIITDEDVAIYGLNVISDAETIKNTMATVGYYYYSTYYYKSQCRMYFEVGNIKIECPCKTYPTTNYPVTRTTVNFDI